MAYATWRACEVTAMARRGSERKKLRGRSMDLAAAVGSHAGAGAVPGLGQGEPSAPRQDVGKLWPQVAPIAADAIREAVATWAELHVVH